MYNSFTRENSKRLKNYFKPFNTLLGDPNDPDRFLFNVHGLPKIHLPSSMKNLPLIHELIKRKSLSAFIRSSYFFNNFRSVSHLHFELETVRLRYDFPFWISKTYDPNFSFNGFQSLVRNLQKLHSSFSPLNVIIRKNEDQDISNVIFLFIMWCKSFGQDHANVMTVTSSKTDSKKFKSILLDWSESSSSKKRKFIKTDYANSIYNPSTKSKFWFVPYYSSGNCRGLDFTILYFSNMGEWKNTGENSNDNIISATFPVVNCSKDNMIILEAGPIKRNSIFTKEIRAAERNLTPFHIISMPWFDDHEKFYRFDFPVDKIKFFNNIIKYQNRKTFHNYPKVSGKKLFELWLRGLPLEAIHWYASESLYYKSLSQFLNRFPDPTI